MVALESTLITHGLPPPHSSELPKECEAILRNQGVTPATIAIIDGRIKVGLSEAELDRLAEMGFAARKDGAKNLWKVGRRELAAAVVKGVVGGTTVSGTMAVSHLAGIKVFSTGGIGGVHRGAETSFDISSDLISLSDTPVAVVCAGSKSILDIGLTLEYLEAHAVPVAALGTSDWPAFYTPKSGFKAPMTLDTPLQAAETIALTDKLGLPSSLLLGVPIPEEYHAAGEALQVAVEQAVRESVENGMAKSGKQVTPWLLERVGQLTKGEAVVSNKALIKNNVRVGGEVALEYARLLKNKSGSKSSAAHVVLPPFTAKPEPTLASTPPPPPTPASHLASGGPSPLVIVGSLAIDITMSPASDPAHTTAPGTVALSLGGVAGNVAGAARSCGVDDVLLVAPVGADFLGSVASEGLAGRGMRSDGLVRLGAGEGGTPTCGILLDPKGELVGGVADMGVVAEMKGEAVVERIAKSGTKSVCFDGNLSKEAMASIIKHADDKGIRTFFEPTSNAKSLSALRALQLNPAWSDLPPTQSLITYATPNIHELATLYDFVSDSEHPVFASRAWLDSIPVSATRLAARLPTWVLAEGVAQRAIPLLSIFECLFVKSGPRGLVVVQRVQGRENVDAWVKLASAGEKGCVVSRSEVSEDDAVVVCHFEALKLEQGEVGTVTGAGDNLAGAMLAAMVRGLDPGKAGELRKIVEVGQRAAVATLRSKEAVGDHTELCKLLQ